MKLEILRIIADELADGTHGVNALLSTVPRDAGDPEPPALHAIYDETRKGWLARGELPEELKAATENPFLVVTMLGDLDFGGRSRPSNDAGGLVRATFRVTVQYVTHQAFTERGEQDGLYTGRAVRSVLQQLFSPARAAARERNGVQLEVLQNITELNVFETIEDRTVIANIVVLTGTARETSW